MGVMQGEPGGTYGPKVLDASRPPNPPFVFPPQSGGKKDGEGEIKVGSIREGTRPIYEHMFQKSIGGSYVKYL